MKLLALGGPIGCLINPTWAVSALVAGGKVAAAEFAISWAHWWVGDTVGVLVFTPMILMWAGPEAGTWRRRRLSVAAPLLTMLAAAILAFFWIGRLEQEGIRLDFEVRSNHMITAIRTSFDSDIDIAQSLGSFVSASAVVERDEFHRFVRYALANHPGIRALSWNPRVSDGERTGFVQRLRNGGMPDFEIRELTSNGGLTPVASRPEYVVVQYIEPQRDNERAVGFDVLSEPVRREALERARDTGEPAATATILHMQEKHHQPGILIFVPVYAGPASPPSVELRRDRCLGFATALLRIPDVIASALEGVAVKGIQISLFDKSRLRGGELMWTAAGSSAPLAAPSGPTFEFERDFDMAGRRWSLRARGTPAFIEATRSWKPWEGLAGGMRCSAPFC
jgi:CHASE1-domain containing sensor protein